MPTMRLIALHIAPLYRAVLLCRCLSSQSCRHEAFETFSSVSLDLLTMMKFTLLALAPQGGYRAWDLAYRPDGRKRERGNWADKSSGELEWWTASN